MSERAGPAVSVMTIVRNGERFIADAVESVRVDASRCPDIRVEHVVVNDGSTDRTEEILAGLAARVPHLRVDSIPPSGIPVARNRALALATGDFVAVLDADDVQLPGRIQAQVDFLQGNPQHGMVGGQELAFDQSTGWTRVVRHPLSDEEVRGRWVRAHVFTHSAIMMRAATLERVGRYDTGRVHGDEDHHLWIRMAREAKVANLDQLVVLRRYHPRQITRSRPFRDLQLKLSLRLMAIRELGLPAERYFQLVWPLASVLPTRGKRFFRRLMGEQTRAGPLTDFLAPSVIQDLPEALRTGTTDGRN